MPTHAPLLPTSKSAQELFSPWHISSWVEMNDTTCGYRRGLSPEDKPFYAHTFTACRRTRSQSAQEKMILITPPPGNFACGNLSGNKAGTGLPNRR